MLTDIFATRYEDRPIWTEVGDRERTLIVQMWRIVKEQVMPYWNEKGEINKGFVPLWKDTESRLSMELGLPSLFPSVYGYYDNSNVWKSGVYTPEYQCERWMTDAIKATANADHHMKERVSFVELALRSRGQQIKDQNAEWQGQFKTRNVVNSLIAGKGNIPAAGAVFLSRRLAETKLVNSPQTWHDELNARFKQAKAPLSCNNDFIQIAKDELVEVAIAQPFWTLVQDSIWVNVDTDMKEAVDRQESNDRDPAFYAVRALESTIKIICDRKGWTTGTEKGAHAYIDNLQAAANGKFIERWEADAMKLIFTSIRNPLGHGPGSADMPKLTDEQTGWTIEAAMSWTKSLVNRMQP